MSEWKMILDNYGFIFDNNYYLDLSKQKTSSKLFN